MAFDPDYAQNGFFYVFYSAVSGGRNVVARYTRSIGSPDVADPNTGVEIFSVPHPAAFHNGGMLAFGPADGYLYVSSGDGGDYCDRIENAQSGTVDLGKILRIDVRHTPATVPDSNPFAGPDGINDEIWALGLRNPWRFSFDRATADLFIADVGQAQREEIDFQAAASAGGENYGWSLYEGINCPNPSCATTTCSVAGYAPPILDYDHSLGCAVTGGYVDRGCRMPDLAGTYSYAGFCSAFIRTFRRVGGIVTDEQNRTAELAPGGGLAIGWITSFGEIASTAPPPVRGRSSASTPPPLHPGRGGDTSVPPVKKAFYYVVTAVNQSGQETSPGKSTGGSPRPLAATPCPP